jgi:GDP-L-fucose synthase
MNIDNKRVLITGGTGMVGRALVELLKKRNCDITIASLDDSDRVPEGVRWIYCDLTDINECERAVKGQELVFHLAGVKGSPKLTQTHPASFLVPMLMFNTNLLEAARREGVEWTLYTSSVGVYAQAEVFHEDEMWDRLPSPNDFHAGLAKRMGELQLDAYKTQYNLHNFSIVRPVNIYGKFDNFNPDTSMVVPSLIRRASESKERLVVWGDGSPVRDIVNSRDVASAMVFVVEKEISDPVNVGSGSGVSIKELAETVVKHCPNKLTLEWDRDKPMGDPYRVASMNRLFSHGWKPTVSLDEGIKETTEWYLENKQIGRYDVFKR